MKNVLLIHGFEGSRDSNWLPWLENELSDAGFAVVNETLPNAGSPNFEESMAFLREHTADFGEGDIVVGHSLGALFALKLAEEKALGALYLVAPAIGGLDFNSLREKWVGSDVDALERAAMTPVDMSAVQARIKVAFFSRDDPYVPVKNVSALDESWSVVVLNGYKHFQMKECDAILDRVLKDVPTDA